MSANAPKIPVCECLLIPAGLRAVETWRFPACKPYYSYSRHCSIYTLRVSKPKWASFGHDGMLPDKQAHDQEKRIKYNDLVANAVILQNTVDLTHAIRELVAEGHEVKVEALAAIRPY